jgi:Esterase-like activity of phytase
VGITRRRPRRSVSAALAAAACACALVSAACGSSGAAESRAASPETGAPGRPGPPARLSAPTRVVIDARGLSGLSDLTADGSGALWAVAERTRALVRMRTDGSGARIVPVQGVPDLLDVEGLAWLDGDRVVLATESDDPRRTSDVLLFARAVDGARIVVERTLALDYGRWPISPHGNQGIEGLCRAGRALVAAVESVSGHDARRFAPVAVHDLARGGWTPYLVHLTTQTGKLSAVSCRMRGETIDVMAVERHFEVARLIRFELPGPGRETSAPVTKPAGPERPPPVVIEPVLVADLAPLLLHEENFEGLVWDGERAIALVVDNDWATVTGPNLLVRTQLGGPVPLPSPPGRSAKPLPAGPATAPAPPAGPSSRPDPLPR